MFSRGKSLKIKSLFSCNFIREKKTASQWHVVLPCNCPFSFPTLDCGHNIIYISCRPVEIVSGRRGYCIRGIGSRSESGEVFREGSFPNQTI
jgi:hypothetical protein